MASERATCSLRAEYHDAAAPSDMDELAARSLEIAHRIEASSRRSDVRRTRARIALLLLRLRCPLAARPRRSWYVPGAVARLGTDGLRRVWRSHFGEEPPHRRTIQRHLGALELAAVLVRAPGDFQETMADPRHPERRPRYPDTFHVLASGPEATWWARVGRELLRRRPDVRSNPHAWAMVFGDWRKRLERGGWQRSLFPELDEDIGAAPGHDPVRMEPHELERSRGRAAVLREALRARADQLGLSSALAAAGCQLRGRWSFEVLRRFERLEGATAMLVLALERGDRVRNAGGWIVRAWRHAAASELRGALAFVRRPLRGSRCRNGRRGRPPAT